MFQFEEDSDLWAQNLNQQQSGYPYGSVGPQQNQGQGAFNPSATNQSNQNNQAALNPWTQLRNRKKQSPFQWCGPGYNLAANLFQANRGTDMEFDSAPSRSASMLSTAAFGDRELDRQALGYYTPTYDSGYSPFYSPQVETSYSPYFNESTDIFYNPYQELMSY